jgi:hypothetical protein
MTMIMRPNDLKILKNANQVLKLWDLSIFHDIMCEGHGKHLMGFYHFDMYDAYKSKYFR